MSLLPIKRISSTTLIVAPLLFVHAALLGWIGWHSSPTIDEVAHLPAGVYHWRFRKFDQYAVNPPLIRSIAAIPVLFTNAQYDWRTHSDRPALRSEYLIGRAFLAKNGSDAFWYFTLARWACIPIMLVGAYTCYAWATNLYGRRSGILALMLWCFCPNILGNGALITPDAGAAALGVGAGFSFWRWTCAPTIVRALCAGAMLGIAALTKTTWLFLFILWPFSLCAMWASDTIVHRPTLLRRSSRVGQLIAVLATGLYIINLGYAFEGSCRSLGSFTFVSRLLSGGLENDEPGNRFEGTPLGYMPVLLPENYLAGIDVQLHDFELGKWSYLNGDQRLGGWWYYYCYALCVKMPIGTLALFIFACLYALLRAIGCPLSMDRNDDSRAMSRPSMFHETIVVIGPAAAVLVVVSSATGFNRYFRYIVPMLPFVYVWTSQVANAISTVAPPRGSTESTSYKRMSISVAIVLAVVLSITSSMGIVPHSLSYFNELVGGPRLGYLHLVDANIDWGQDLFYLKYWYDANPVARPLYLSYFGSVDPSLAGIKATPISSHSSIPRDGWIAVSVNSLAGYRYHGSETDAFAGMRGMPEAASAGYSIRLYRLTGSRIIDDKH